MGVFEWTFVIYCLGGCLLWLLLLGSFSWISTKVSTFESFTPADKLDWPLLSIVVAACNEEKTIEPALKTILREDYPDLEIIYVNDRSTDKTGEIIEQFALTDHRLKPFHISELPDGWLGKVYALHRGCQLAKGQFVLFTDADIHFKRGTLRKAVAHAVAENLDHFTILPRPISPSFLFEVALTSFGGLFMLLTRVHQVEAVGSNAFTGCGAFNLVRKSIFDKTPGFSWLKMEVGDDVALGMMMKQVGSKSSFATTEEAISVSWYHSFAGMVRGLEKNSFGIISQYNLWLLILQVIFIWAFISAPILALSATSFPFLWLAGALVGALLLILALAAKIIRGAAFMPIFLMPLGFFLLSLILLRAGILCVWRGGIVWRGTLYTISELKKGQKLKLPLV